jgi:hypothetical protein
VIVTDAWPNGAVVSTVVLLRERRREQSRCEVKVGLYDVIQPGLAGPPQNAVRVNLVNHSTHAVRWVGLAFHRQGGAADEWLLPTGYAMPPMLPLNVPARDAADVMLDRAKLEEAGLDWAKPVLVQAWLSTGDEFLSKEEALETHEANGS